MITLRPAAERGETRTDWLDSKHSFSFADYYDEAHMNFGPLRVINEDWITRGAGFPMHGHRNMEIITYVLEGAVAHKDSLGNGSEIRPGEIQMMSAGKGILHSELNPSDEQDLHLLQIWIQPDVAGTTPGYQQAPFDASRADDALLLLASPDGAQGSLTIRQDARLYMSKLSSGGKVTFDLGQGRGAWIQVARGEVSVSGQQAKAGDGIAVTNESEIFLQGEKPAEVLLFDLPL